MPLPRSPHPIERRHFTGPEHAEAERRDAGCEAEDEGWEEGDTVVLVRGRGRGRRRRLERGGAVKGAEEGEGGEEGEEAGGEVDGGVRGGGLPRESSHPRSSRTIRNIPISPSVLISTSWCKACSNSIVHIAA